MLSRATSIPILVTLWMAGFLVVLLLEWWNPQRKRLVYGLGLCVYGILYLLITFVSRESTLLARIRLTPFWSIRAALSWTNGQLRIENYRYLREIFLNVLLYFPLGLLLSGWIPKKRFVFGVGIGLSIITEMMQYFLHLGLCELDDVIFNSVGLVLGMMTFYVTQEAAQALKSGGA